MITYDLENGFIVQLVSTSHHGHDRYFATVRGDHRQSAPVCPIAESFDWAIEAISNVTGEAPSWVECTDSDADQNWREYEYSHKRPLTAEDIKPRELA